MGTSWRCRGKEGQGEFWKQKLHHIDFHQPESRPLWLKKVAILLSLEYSITFPAVLVAEQGFIQRGGGGASFPYQKILATICIMYI